jgi:hypothetical protein
MKLLQGKILFVHTRSILDNIPKYVYYQSIKVYIHSPKTIKNLSGDRNKFKLALKKPSRFNHADHSFTI